MKKYLSFLFAGLLVFAVSNKALSQSVIMVDNPEGKPVPVKIMNPAAPGQNIQPFTQMSADVAGVTKVTITASSNETKVVEYVLANGSAATYVKISFNTRIFYLFIPATALPTIPLSRVVNTYSGAINIVIKSGETYTFEVNGSDNKFILLSGYTIIK
jgi:hypothetical protein